MKITMKTMIFGLLVMIFSFTITSCGDDLTPYNIENDIFGKVKKQMVGTWTFVSVTVTQNNVSATTSKCDKLALFSGGFSNDSWKLNTPLPNFIFNLGGVDDVGYNLPCLLGNPTPILKFVITETSDKTVQFGISNGRTFIIDPANIKTNEIKLTLTNANDYIITYIFSK